MPDTLTAHDTAVTLDRVAAIEAAVRADSRAWVDAYRLGYHTGYCTGYAAGEADEAQLWTEALGIAQHSGTETYAELQRRRDDDCREPCAVHCGRCSRCVRADYLRRQESA